jgi:hypothetical protein
MNHDDEERRRNLTKKSHCPEWAARFFRQISFFFLVGYLGIKSMSGKKKFLP